MRYNTDMSRKLALATLAITFALPFFATAASCPSLTRNLSFGSRGSNVVQLQQFLISQNLLSADSATGYFGRLTQSAVQKWQCKSMNICSGSPITNGWGNVGPKTRAAIALLCKNTASPPPRPPTLNHVCPALPPTCPSGFENKYEIDAYGCHVNDRCVPVQPPGIQPPQIQSCTPVSPQTQTLSCPPGQAGSITQARTSSCPGPTWSAWQTTNNSCQFTRPALKFPNAFQVLVDTNQINPDEALQASRFAADGVWGVTVNSSQSIDWKKLFSDLNANTWAVAENDPADVTGNQNNLSRETDFVSANISRIVDDAMYYYEDPQDKGRTLTVISDDHIAQFASHVVPNYGPVGSRLLVLGRTFAASDPSHDKLVHALTNPNVAGVVFEMQPLGYRLSLEIETGCKYALSLNKRCYFLMPPAMELTTDLLYDVQKGIEFLAQSGGILNNPNVYVVPAIYVRPNAFHFLSTSPDDHNSVEAINAWLNQYRQNKTWIAQYNQNQNRRPRGNLEVARCDVIAGWAQDEDTPDVYAVVHFYIDNQFAGYTIASSTRSDLCTAIGSCNHGYAWSVPSQLRTPGTHSITVYGIDTRIENASSDITGATKTFQCSQ